MSRPFSIHPLVPEWHSRSYDCSIATIGYEARSRYINEAYALNASTRLAYGFDTLQVFEYARNKDFFVQAGFTISEGNDAFFRDWIFNYVQEQSQDGRLHQVLVDISSLTRARIAHLLLMLSSWRVPVTVTFVYSLAAYLPPPSTEMQVNNYVGPVLPEFSGWWDEPDRDLAAVVGLGYEQDKALGAVEHLQAGQIWTLTPVSSIAEYSPALEKANKSLLKVVPQRNRLVYEVGKPVECLMLLESLVYGLLTDKNPVLLPFGPKIFTLSALLVGLLHPSVPVWRVSAESDDVPLNRRASGAVYGLEVRFQ